MDKHEHFVPNVTDSSKSPELRLRDAWIANSCGDANCMTRRLEVAVRVLFGDKTHIHFAELVEKGGVSGEEEAMAKRARKFKQLPQVKAWRDWVTGDGAKCFGPGAEGQYLENRLLRAFQAGWDAAKRERGGQP